MSNGGAQFQFFQFVDDTGTPYASSKLYHYAAGTTTDKDIWTDEAKTTPAAQPIVADSKGIITFYADGDHKFVLKDSSDNTLYTWDNVRITSDSATMWEGNHGTAYPSAAATNIWQLFAKHTAGNVLQELGINNGSSFVPLVGIDSNLKYAVDTGAADAYLIAPNPPITAYTAGQIFYMKATNANTGASTVNVNNLGIKSITKDGAIVLTAGDILAGEIVTLIYDGTNFQLVTALRGDGTVNTNLNADMVDGLHSTNITGGSKLNTYRTTTQSILDTIMTKVIYDTETYDTSSAYDTATGCFLVPDTGYYSITASGVFATNSTGYREMYILSGDICGTSNIAHASSFVNNNGASLSTYISCHGEAYLTAGQYVWIEVYQDSGGALNFFSASSLKNQFLIHRIDRL